MTHTTTLFTPALGPHLGRVRASLLGLSQPPQVLLFEGGTEAERQSLARWWAAVQHCTGAAGQEPCLECGPCAQIAAQVHLDVLAFDGRISNKDDEETPGPVRALTIDNVRALKAALATPPHGGTRRVVILCGLEGERREAANALLKVLEEPCATAIFVLLTPMRAQILPTLVSRSCVLTLPWPGADTAVDAGADTSACVEAFTQGLADMMATGRGWWALTGGKGAVDAALAETVLLTCRRALTRAMRGQAGQTGQAGQGQDACPLAARLGALSHEQAYAAGRLLDEAQEALRFNVTPARVLDWLAVGLHSVGGQA